MVGRELAEHVPEEQNIGENVLRVERLTREGVFVDVSFDVRAGEIVALAGLVGAGRSEVAAAIFGIDRFDAGSVTLNGEALRRGSPSAAMDAGIGFVPGGPSPARARHGDVDRPQHHARIASAPSSRRADPKSRGAGLRARLGNAPPGQYARLSSPMTSLSGGNQQKVVLAKWLARRPKLLIVDEPTRGIDVGTKAEVHRLLEELVGTGVAVLVISSELPEVLRLANRILVMREGRIVAEFAHADASEETIVAAATGQLEGAAT